MWNEFPSWQTVGLQILAEIQT